MLSSATLRFGVIAACVLVLVSSLPSRADTPSDQQVSHVKAFLEFALGFSLNDETMRYVRAGLANDMSTNPAGAAATFKDMDTVMAAVGSQSSAANAVLRSLLEPQLIAAWQGDMSDPTGSSQALVAQWRKHNHIIAEGRPPLRRKVANAFIAMIEFLCKESGKPVPSALASHSKFRSRLAKQYAAAPSDGQLNFNKVETLWLALQTEWKNATPAQRAAMRR